jgi:tetratricopeptide (TPR) repeat protein
MSCSSRNVDLQQWIFCLILPFLLFTLNGCYRDGEKSKSSFAETDTVKYGIIRLTEEIEKDDRNGNLYHARAKYFLADRSFDNALRDINKAFQINDQVSSYYITLADIQLMMGQPRNSMDALNKALLLDDTNKEALLKLARLNLIMKDYEATFRALNRLIGLDSYNPQAYFLKGISLLEKGDTVNGVYDLMKAADQDQNFFEANLQLGELFSMKNDDLAEGYLRNAIRIRPDSPEAMYLLAMFYQNTGQYENALATYHQLSEVDSAFRQATYNTGYIYLVYLNDLPKAIKAFSAAITIDPDYTEAYYNRGLAYELSEDFTNAYADYRKALSITVNFQKAVEGLNRLDRKAGIIK